VAFKTPPRVGGVLKCKVTWYGGTLEVAKKKSKKENAIVRYLRETRAELRKVHWPTRQEALNLTRVVLVVTVSMAFFLGLLDRLFSMGLQEIIAGSAVAIGITIVVAVAGVLVFVILSRQRA
jgi:preprotein translocase subunit SecE